MQNETQNKPKEIISFSNLPSIIVVVVFIVGIGAVFGLLGYLVCGIKENVTPATQKPSVKITDEITGDYFGNDFIQVKLPQKNATIKNPVLISGKANVDEANVRVKITDDNENILADTFITADGWMDKLYLFEKEISYNMPSSQNGLIEIFEESAKDGSEIYKIEVLVVFENYEDAFSGWKVYRNEEFGFEMKYPKEFNFKEKKSMQRDEIWLGGIYTEDKGNLSLLVKEQKLDPENIEGIYGKINGAKTISINGIEAYVYMEGDAGCGGYTISIPKNEVTIKISFSDCKEQITEIVNNRDQILSTFKFIEK